MITTNETDRDQAVERLRKLLAPGETVYTILRHVSASGMMRVIDPIVIETGQPRSLCWSVATATEGRMDSRRQGVRVSGAGMDMGFHLVYSLSSALFPDGFGCIGEGCPSNDHSNGDRDYTPGRKPGAWGLKGHWHRDGGYALRHRWL